MRSGSVGMDYDRAEMVLLSVSSRGGYEGVEEALIVITELQRLEEETGRRTMIRISN